MAPFRSRCYVWPTSAHVAMYGPLQLTLLCMAYFRSRYYVWLTSGHLAQKRISGTKCPPGVCYPVYIMSSRCLLPDVRHIVRVCVTRCIACHPGVCYQTYIMSSRCVLPNVRPAVHACLCPRVRHVVQVFITPMYVMSSRYLLLPCTSCCPGVYYPVYVMSSGVYCPGVCYPM